MSDLNFSRWVGCIPTLPSQEQRSMYSVIIASAELSVVLKFDPLGQIISLGFLVSCI